MQKQLGVTERIIVVSDNTIIVANIFFVVRSKIKFMQFIVI